MKLTMWGELPESYREAFDIRAKYYAKDEPCKWGHRDRRWTRTQMCMACARRASWLKNYSVRMPPWADVEAIDAIYQEAARLTVVTGIRHEVDHIVPCHGVNVCGLHVEANLQILTRKANHEKGNSWDGVKSAYGTIVEI